jgi:hypothetical protein
MAFITQKSVEDASDIGLAVVSSGLIGQMPSMITSPVYRSSVSPLLASFKRTHGTTPRLQLKSLMKDYASSRLRSGYEVKHFGFWAQPIKSFIWTCIHPSTTNPSAKQYKLGPQLIVSIGDKGVSAGLAYGVWVQDAMASMTKVKDSVQLQTDLYGATRTASNWTLRPEFSDPAATRKQGPIINVRSPSDISDNWYDRPRLVRFWPRQAIPANIESEVVSTLDEMCPIFKKL